MKKMTYTQYPTTYSPNVGGGGSGILGIIAAIASTAVAIVETVRRIVDKVKERKARESAPSLPYTGNTVDMVYNDNAGTWVSRMPITNMNNGGMNNMNYDVLQGLDNYDFGNTNMYNRNLPYGYGYDANKPDYIWSDKTLGQVPSTSQYVPFESRIGFDPVPYLKSMNSYVALMDPYYPYRSTNLFTKYDGIAPPPDDSYLKDPNAGILYKDLKNHFTRRDYNPYEPARPFATYNPNSINANDPRANPYNMTQEQINGIVNRSNYYKDYILNINKVGAPNNIDNPWNLLGGPSYTGPDGKLYIRQVPPQLDYHPRREFLSSGRTKPYPTLGGEVFGRSIYNGFDFATMNQPNNYNNISTGGNGYMAMYDSRNYGVDPLAPPLMSIPYIRNAVQKEMEENARKQMAPTQPYESCFSTPQQNQNIGLKDPNMFANPYSKSIQNQIDRSQLLMDPKFGMMPNDGSPDDKFARLLQIQPPGTPMTPQQEIRSQMAMNQMYGMNNVNPLNQMCSVLGPNTHVGLSRQGYNNNTPQAGTYIPNASMYTMQNQMAAMRQRMNGGGVFVDEPRMMGNMNYGMNYGMNNTMNMNGGLQHASGDAGYGMSPQQPQQPVQQSPWSQMNMNQMGNQMPAEPQMGMGHVNNQQPVSMGSLFGDPGQQVMAKPTPQSMTQTVPQNQTSSEKYGGMNESDLVAHLSMMQNGDTPTDNDINQPENPTNPDAIAHRLWGI